jgi:hypothetical protein
VEQFGGLGIGYLFTLAALLFVLVYLLVVTRLLHLFAPHEVMVPTYEAPPEVSPAVAAWLFDLQRLAALDGRRHCEYGSQEISQN